jgi:hypothetical protein
MAICAVWKRHRGKRSSAASKIPSYGICAAGIYAAEAEDRQVARAGELIAFDIPRQPLAGALQAYGQATGIQVLYESNSAVGRTSAAVEGKLTADVALSQLLAETDLKVRYIPSDVITLSASAKLASGTPRHRRSHSSIAISAMPILQKMNLWRPNSAGVALLLCPLA